MSPLADFKPLVLILHRHTDAFAPGAQSIPAGAPNAALLPGALSRPAQTFWPSRGERRLASPLPPVHDPVAQLHWLAPAASKGH